jgi:hypothetical protein
VDEKAQRGGGLGGVPGNLCGDGDDNAVAIGLKNEARWHSMIGKSAGKAPPYFLIPWVSGPHVLSDSCCAGTLFPRTTRSLPGLGLARPGPACEIAGVLNPPNFNPALWQILS